MRKKLAIFCDGTWNEPAVNPTNVAKLFAATCHDNEGVPQVTYYIAGIGTHWYDRYLGGAFGVGMSDNIKAGYGFLCSNYEPGDDIYLFGFSRGAFTARSLAGLIHNMGILKREYFVKINEAYDHYRDRSAKWHPSHELGSPTTTFRQRYTYGGETVTFLGVWDTVGALGAPYGFIIIGYLLNRFFDCQFHDLKLSSSIQSACHAVARDEHRWPFRPTLWELHPSHDPSKFIEKWFPGVHSDVGGGYMESGLSDRALQWMAMQAERQGLKSMPIVCSTQMQRHDSQRWYYRWATLLFVKWPVLWLVVFPGKLVKPWPGWVHTLLYELGVLVERDIPLKVARIRKNGDYKRR